MNLHEKTKYKYESDILKSFLKKKPIVLWKDLIKEEKREIDFRFNTRAGIVGIELTRFSKDNGAEAKRQRFYDSVVLTAQKIFYSRHKIHPYVFVNLWHKEHLTSSKHKKQFSQAIANTISQHLIHIKTLTGIESIKLDLYIGEQREGRLYVYNLGSELKSSWTRSDPYWVRSFPYIELQAVIDRKNDKIVRYRSCSDKTYLLITANKRLPEEAVHFDNDLLKQRFYSKFDKVFFFDVCTKELYPLKTTKRKHLSEHYMKLQKEKEQDV